ncbi:MAG: CBS domain-containing protein [Mariprofundaceae bacterium]|nr:CBS domain-containing protein [Mariprofundaceae bacterium]
MLAENIMLTNFVAAHVDECVSDVVDRMRAEKLRMLPVLTDEGVVVGVISTFSLLEYIVPDYIASGDLNAIAYAPDMGVLRKHYHQAAKGKVSAIMDKNPLLVGHDESLLSTSAALVTFNKHEYALVVDDKHRLTGIISAGDILDRLRNMVESIENDA